MANRWVLPEGMDELLPADAKHVEHLRRSLLNVYASWGYQLVIPPFVEFSESLLLDENPDLDLQTFKIIDRSSGKTMGLRADMTPQIARIDAAGMAAEGVNRLCYAGSVIHSFAKSPLASRSPIQIGCEIYGSASVNSDIEVISLMLETVLASGVEQLTLDLGHVAILDSIVAGLDLDASELQGLNSALSRKSEQALASVLTRFTSENIFKQQLIQVAKIQGGTEVLPRLRAALSSASDAVQSALDDLELISRIIKSRYPNVNIFIDLTEVRGFRYHTGLVFAALSPTVGEPVATGGRYDELSARYGRDRPATGFTSDLKALLKLDKAPKDEVAAAILVDASIVEEAWHYISELRAAGHTVIEGQADSGSLVGTLQCRQKVVLSDGKPQLVAI